MKTIDPRTRKLGLLLATGVFLVAGFSFLLGRGLRPAAPVLNHTPAQAADRPVELAEVGVRAPESPAAVERTVPDVALLHARWSDVILGTVVDGISGRPVPKFRLFVCPSGEKELLAQAEENPAEGFLRHDPDGRFRLSGLPAGTYSVLVDPDASGFEKTVIHDVRVPVTELLVARVGRGAHVEASVLDAAGRPAAGIEVVLTEELDATAPTLRKTDADGRVLFTRLAPGGYRLLARAAEPLESAPFRVEPNLRVEKELVLPGGSTLNISVLDVEGEPLADAQVFLAGRAGVLLSARADPAGAVRIEGLSSRRYAVQVVRPGFETASRDVEMQGDQEISVVLAQASR